MSVEVHIEWAGETHLVGRLHTAERSPAVSFEYVPAWLGRAGAFAIDPTSLPLRPGPHHSPALFGAMQDCGPDRWGRMLVERAVRKHVLDRKPYQDLDYVLALDDASRIGALRFRVDAASPFLAAGHGKIPPVVQLAALLNAANAVHGETETAQDLRYLLGQGSPLGGARPKSAIVLPDGQLAISTGGILVLAGLGKVLGLRLLVERRLQRFHEAACGGKQRNRRQRTKPPPWTTRHQCHTLRFLGNRTGADYSDKRDSGAVIRGVDADRQPRRHERARLRHACRVQCHRRRRHPPHRNSTPALWHRDAALGSA